MKGRLWKYGGYLLFGAASYFVGAFGLMVADRMPPIEYIAAEANEPTVSAGASIGIHFAVDRHRICSTQKVNRTLVDAAGIVHAITQYTKGADTKPGTENYDRIITIPEIAASGPATYYIELFYTCNPVHRLFGWPVIVRSPDVHFTIKPSAIEGYNLPPLLYQAE